MTTSPERLCDNFLVLCPFCDIARIMCSSDDDFVLESSVNDSSYSDEDFVKTNSSKKRKKGRNINLKKKKIKSSHVKGNLAIKASFPCQMCDKIYKNKGDLTRHCLTHQTSD